MQKRLIRCVFALALGASAAGLAHAGQNPAPAATSQAATVSAEQFKKFEGDYQLLPGMIISVFQQDGKFMTQASRQSSFEIFADSPSTFHATVADIKISFTMGADGMASHFNLTQNGRVMPAAPRVK